MFFKIGVLKIFCNIYRKTPVLEYLFDKVAGVKVCEFFFCEYCENFKNSFFYRTSLVAASEDKQEDVTVSM